MALNINEKIKNMLFKNSYSESTTDGYSANYLNGLIQTGYANGQSVSINDLNTTGKWRIYIPANSNDANYLGWYGNTLVETFVQSPNNGCIQRITKYTTGTVLIRTCSTNAFSYDDPLYSDEGDVLYYNSTGSTGDITLNKNASNYRYLEIYYKSNDNAYNSTKVYDPNGKTVSLICTWSTGTPYLYIKSRAVVINGTTISGTTSRSSEVRIGNNVATTASNTVSISIVRVVGYR